MADRPANLHPTLNNIPNYQLRFSGWHIPFEHWDEHPCWEFALNEESREGQDETTMRPCDEFVITEDTDAAGYAIGASGKKFSAMIALQHPNRNSAKGVMVYVDGKLDGRKAEFRMKRGVWTERTQAPSWFPTWTSAKSETGLLPLTIVTLASDKKTGKPMSFTISELT